MNDLIKNIDRLHTTEMGMERIKRNLNLKTDDVVAWCKENILNPTARMERTGKKLVYHDRPLQDHGKCTQFYNHHSSLHAAIKKRCFRNR